MADKVPETRVSTLALITGEAAATDRPAAEAAVNSRPRPGKTPPPPFDTAIAYRVPDAATVSGLSRATLFKLIAEGKLHSVFVAGRRLIPSEALRALINGRAQ